ncbi:MAG: hypothetical protein V7606_1477, partial [Burkholderiales bacterium]
MLSCRCECDHLNILPERLKYGALCPVLDERQRRQWAAAEALAYGWGGVTAVCHATGMSQDTVRKGITELAAREVDPEAPIDTLLREPGAGPKRLIDKDPALLERLKQMVDPVT